MPDQSWGQGALTPEHKEVERKIRAGLRECDKCHQDIDTLLVVIQKNKKQLWCLACSYDELVK